MYNRTLDGAHDKDSGGNSSPCMPLDTPCHNLSVAFMRDLNGNNGINSAPIGLQRSIAMADVMQRTSDATFITFFPAHCLVSKPSLMRSTHVAFLREATEKLLRFSGGAYLLIRTPENCVEVLVDPEKTQQNTKSTRKFAARKIVSISIRHA